MGNVKPEVDVAAYEGATAGTILQYHSCNQVILGILTMGIPCGRNSGEEIDSYLPGTWFRSALKKVFLSIGELHTLSQWSDYKIQ